MWWTELQKANDLLRQKFPFRGDEVAAIGLSYQMHGLVALDKSLQPVRPAIIWCDSRAVETGNRAWQHLGKDWCLTHYLNAPGNFTASKLRWVHENEPGLYDRIQAFMLPGDYIALKLTGVPATTVSGLSEGICWDYREQGIARELLNYYEIDPKLIPPLVPQLGEQGRLTTESASVLGLISGIPVTYRAGDQPNNACSLNVLKPGEVAATAGTSGVVYGVTDAPVSDALSRVNGFVHVNHSSADPRYGILLCVNGTGILNSWTRNNFFQGMPYDKINALAAMAPVGSDGLYCYPFGNGAERILENRDPGASFHGLQFNRHGSSHLARAAQEGIVFALQFGMEIMQQMGLQLKTVRAGHANMFLSPVFAEAFANTSGCTVELYNTDGALGAARAAGVGAGVFSGFAESFRGMELINRYEPLMHIQEQYAEAYGKWKGRLSQG
jgi:xylulokinase